jgi:hypothetical protein
MLEALAVSVLLAAADVPAARFPAVSGTSLAGKPFALPGDFAAPLNLVFVAFQRGQQHDVDTWKAAADAAKAANPRLAVWELPTLPRSAAMFRGFIDGGMRRGITDPATRAATITLYIDKTPFEAALGIDGESTIGVFLVRPNGELVWRATGPATPAGEAALAAAVAAHQT